MMKKLVHNFLFLILALAGFLLPGAEVRASHYVGSDVTFAYAGMPGMYTVKLRFFRDCGGIMPGQTISLGGSSSCGTASAQLTLLTTTDASAAEVCPGQATECSGNPAVPGTEVWEYEGTIQLSPCADWFFRFTGNARNDAIINLNNGNTDALDWFTDAMINTTGTINNNSPILSAPPVPYVCYQDTVNYNPQATDPDGDSLVYELVGARASGGILIPYTPGYSATQPFGTPAAAVPNPFPTTLNSQTGQLTFRPMLLGTYVVVVKITEFRTINGVPVQVGFIHRDVEFEVLQCTTPAPELGLLKLLHNNAVIDSFSFSQVPQLNACMPYCIEIPATSFGAGVAVNLSINSNTSNEIPNSTFTVLNQNTPNPVGLLCFTPDPALAGQTFSYTIAVSDNVCPIPNDFIRALQVQVVKNTGFSVQASAASVCVGDSVQLSAQALPGTVPLTSAAYASLVWSAVDPVSGQPVAGQFQGGQSSSASLNPVGTPTQAVTYILAGTSVIGCVDSAQVQVSSSGVQPTVVSISAQNTTLMQGQTTTINAVVQGPAAAQNPAFTYLWSPAAGLSDPTLLNPEVSFSGLPSITYTLTASNGTCTDAGTISFNFVANAAPIAGFDHSFTGCCQLSITSTAIGGNTYSYDFGDGSAISTQVNPTHTYTTSGTFTITQTVTNSLGTDVANRTVSVLVSAPEDLLAQQLTLYPNPSSGNFQLNLSALTNAEPVQVEVYNLLGQCMLSQATAGGDVREFSLKNVPGGYYLVRIKLNNLLISKPLQVQQ